MIDEQFFPVTAKEALKQFEKGELIYVIELGGLGPLYELAIWFAIFRMIKKYHKEDMNKWVRKTKEGFRFKRGSKPYLDVADEKLMPICKDLGLSSCQAGAIKWTSWQLMKYGWREMMKRAPNERHFLIGKNVPHYNRRESI